MNMVEIECPHCDEDIEMDDDAVGLFDCPYCDQEFEWGTDDEDEFDELDLVDFDLEPTNEKLSAGTDSSFEYPDNPALRITVGVIFTILMVLFAISSIFVIYSGMVFSSIEAGLEDTFGVESNAGGFVILLGFVMLLVHSSGIFFGIQMAKGRLYGLIASTVISGINLAFTIISHLTDKSEECKAWGSDDTVFVNGSPMEMCTEWGAPSFPIFATILWITMLGVTGTMLFLPKIRYQFD